jgi:NADPH:quinone reductase-like Zn-dependent oxidoreductase
MKAAIYNNYGPPEVVHITNVPKPQPKHNQVLVKVHASTVNRTDCGFRSAEYSIIRLFHGLITPRHKTLGNEFAGVVEAIGNGVTKFKVGDKVFGYNDLTFGGHAEYIAVKETDAIATMPGNYTFEQAAPLTEGSHYALCDIRAANVSEGQNVLVYGASGAIGSAAVQLLLHFGARVTAVCGTPNIEMAKSLGAHTVIDYMQADFTQCGQTFDFIFDAVGKSSFGQCKPLLKPKGIYISTELGKHAENIYLALLTPLKGGKRLLFPLPTITQNDVQFIKELAEKKIFMPVIDRRYPLSEIVEAYRYVETRQKVGNVVIDVMNNHLSNID